MIQQALHLKHNDAFRVPHKEFVKEARHVQLVMEFLKETSGHPCMANLQPSAHPFTGCFTF